MKIALIAPTEIPARRANTIQVMKMAQAMTELGHQVRVASPSSLSALDPISQSLRTWEKLAHFYGLQTQFPVEWLPARPWLRRYDYGLTARRWAAQWGADLVYTRLPQCAAFASRAGMKTIFEVHDLPSGFMFKWLFEQFLTGGGAVRLVTISRALAQDLAVRFNIPTQSKFTLTAPDGVDLIRFTELPLPQAARQKLPADIRQHLGAFVAGFTGHLYAGRGAELILAMAARLPEISFLLTGGELGDVERVKAQAASQNLANVTLTGFVPNADLPLFQAACDVLLMPYQEHVAASSGGNIARYLSPMKLFEYMACGRAILSSNLPVLCETLTSETAILLPPADVGAWVAALQELQSNEAKRFSLGEAARRSVEQYSWENRSRKILDGL
ncbi:MAG: glycosyltransferase family 4 protein [Chloroflexi bacterium]|nr:glycosyltransferase family 4 protein [Chloroflexota bacterium]